MHGGGGGWGGGGGAERGGTVVFLPYRKASLVLAGTYLCVLPALRAGVRSRYTIYNC